MPEFADSQSLLIVDDDNELSAMLATYLGENGYAVSTLSSAAKLDEVLARQMPDLLILDVMMPGEDGLSVARRLSEQLPILILSARGGEVDRILGLEFGVDDYMAKPFNPRELLARIKAVLRRQRTNRPSARTSIDFGDFRLDLDKRQLFRDDVPVPLTTAEFALLKVLAQNPGKVLSRDDLANLANGPDRLPFDRSIDARVTRLRRRLGDDPTNPRYIQTVWGTGYMFIAEINV
jgi:two-component system phosphate regulon response regulator OmpR